MKTTILLILLYSPQSQYFVGPRIQPQPDQATCLKAAQASIGRELEVVFWEKEMMGPLPQVVAAYCVEGAAKQ